MEGGLLWHLLQPPPWSNLLAAAPAAQAAWQRSLRREAACGVSIGGWKEQNQNQVR